MVAVVAVLGVTKVCGDHGGGGRATVAKVAQLVAHCVCAAQDFRAQGRRLSVSDGGIGGQ